MRAVTIGLDIAKSVFQAHVVDEAGEVENLASPAARGGSCQGRARIKMDIGATFGGGSSCQADPLSAEDTLQTIAVLPALFRTSIVSGSVT